MIHAEFFNEEKSHRPCSLVKMSDEDVGGDDFGHENYDDDYLMVASDILQCLY